MHDISLSKLPGVLLVLLTISILVSIGYSQALFGEFLHWDDREYVLYNEHIHNINMDNLLWMFSSYHQSNWHPLTWLSHAIDYAIWNKNPWGHHLVNILWHIANSFMIFIICKIVLGYKSNRTSNNPDKQKDGFILSAVISFLFAIHPLHVESVAWIAERKDLLYSFFFLFSIFLYLKYILSKQVKYKLFSLISFIFAVMSKSMAISLPFVLLIIDIYPFQRMSDIPFLKRLYFFCREKFIFFTVMVAVVVLTIITQSAEGSVKSLEQYPLIYRILNATNSFLIYPLQLVFPVHLSPFYPYPEYIKNNQLIGYIPLLVCIFVFLVSIFFAKTRGIVAPLAVFAAYLVMAMPILGIVQVGDQAHADRYTYLPTLPILILLIFALHRFMLNKSNIKLPVIVVTLATVITLVFITHNQTSYWRNDRVLWSRVVSLYPERAPTAHTNLGNTFLEKDDFKSAEKHYLITRAIQPSHIGNLMNLILVYERTGRLVQARKEWKYILEQHSRNPWLWMEFGDFNLRHNDQTGALRAYATALEKSENSSEIRQALGKRGVHVKK